MVQIKGSAIQETINQIKRRAGDDALSRILGLLDEDARKALEGEIFASTWYPLDYFARFLEIEIKLLANGNEEMVTRGSEAVIERQLRGIYKAFVKLGSPEFIIKRIAAVHATYFQGVPIEVETPAPRIATVRYRGFQKQHRIMGFAIIGFFQRPWRFQAPRTWPFALRFPSRKVESLPSSPLLGAKNPPSASSGPPTGSFRRKQLIAK